MAPFVVMLEAVVVLAVEATCPAGGAAKEGQIVSHHIQKSEYQSVPRNKQPVPD